MTRRPRRPLPLLTRLPLRPLPRLQRLLRLFRTKSANSAATSLVWPDKSRPITGLGLLYRPDTCQISSPCKAEIESANLEPRQASS